MTNLLLCVVGYLLVIGGLAWGAHELGLAGEWIAIGSIILLGIEMASNVARTRLGERSPEDEGEQRVVIDDG